MAEPDQTVSDVMTSSPRRVVPQAGLVEVAEMMRDDAIGTVIVVDDGDTVTGLATDRDLVVRCMAEGKDPSATTIGEACSEDLVSVGPDAPAERAARLMREHAVRRIPVVDAEGRAVGVVSIGDLALTRDPTSALSDISAAPPNA